MKKLFLLSSIVSPSFEKHNVQHAKNPNIFLTTTIIIDGGDGKCSYTFGFNN